MNKRILKITQYSSKILSTQNILIYLEQLVVYFVSGLHTVFYTKYALNRDYKKGVFNFLHESNAVVRPVVNNIFEKIFGNKYHYRIKYIYIPR